MPSKSVPLSVRLSHEDAEFIAALAIPEGVTMSEKVRYLVGEARRRAGRADDRRALRDDVGLMLEGILQSLDAVAEDEREHSRFLTVLLQWLPEIVSLAGMQVGTNKKYLYKREEQCAASVTGFIDALARLALTDSAPCFDEKIMHGMLDPLKEVLAQAKPVTKEEK